MEKINLVEILKDCPKGMELDCMMYEDVYFDYVHELNTIHCYIQHEDFKSSVVFTQYGTPNSDTKSKCVIFPKGKTTWEGFHRPFKDGDIVATKKGLCIGIIKIENGIQRYTYVAINEVNNLSRNISYGFDRLATEEEKQKLFKAIKDNGYRWNSETKTLEKLINKNKFVVGATITNGTITGKIISRDVDSYQLEDGNYVFFNEVHNFELVPNKFDVSTLIPFESRVLVRNADGELWKPAIYGFSHSNGYYVVGGAYWVQCIPYEANKELLRTTNNPEEYGNK